MKRPSRTRRPSAKLLDSQQQDSTQLRAPRLGAGQRLAFKRRAVAVAAAGGAQESPPPLSPKAPTPPSGDGSPCSPEADSLWEGSQLMDSEADASPTGEPQKKRHRKAT